MRKKFLALISVVSGILTFVAAPAAFSDKSDTNAAFACIPAMVCLMTILACDNGEDRFVRPEEPEQETAI